MLQNIAKAQAQIDALESEAQQEEASDPPARRSRNAAKKPAQASIGTNGEISAEAELKQEKDAVADVTEELKEAAIKDGETK